MERRTVPNSKISTLSLVFVDGARRPSQPRVETQPRCALTRARNQNREGLVYPNGLFASRAGITSADRSLRVSGQRSPAPPVHPPASPHPQLASSSAVRELSSTPLSCPGAGPCWPKHLPSLPLGQESCRSLSLPLCWAPQLPGCKGGKKS